MDRQRQTTILAATPPMGWNSWNALGKNIHEEAIKEMADAIISSGMKDVGYEYIVIDDLWSAGRDAGGFLVPDPEKFPSGMETLAGYIHSKGLKLGIYSDAGEKTCAGAVGSLEYERQDATSFAAWEVDFLKYDYCYAPEDQQSAVELYSRMGQALAACGRPIIYSICEWGERMPWLWGTSVGGHMWRTSSDLFDMWDSATNSNQGNGVLMNLEITATLADYAGPGRWNDPDLLLVGLYGRGAIPGPGLTPFEYRSHMNMWCILAAPLMATCDLRNMDDYTRETLTNKEIIAINQDPLGKQGVRTFQDNDHEVWKKPLTGREFAVALFNRSLQPGRITAEWECLGIQGRYQIRDVWARQYQGVFEKSISCDVPSHGTMVFRFIPLDKGNLE